MPDFSSSFSALSPLTVQAIADLNQAVEVRHFPKGQKILSKGQKCRHLYHLDQGLVKLGFENSKKDFVLRFFAEGSILTDLDSFTTQSTSEYTITALEPVHIAWIDYHALEDLCKKHHSMETTYRKFLAMASRNMIRRITEMLEEDAASRYRNFLSQHPQMLQRISLRDLSSYLGITQMSLSRIRAQK